MVKVKKINHTEEIKKQIYKYILMQIARNPLYFFSIQRYLIFIYNLKNVHIAQTNKNHSCFLTGRSRAIYRTFHLSRLKIREHAHQGHFIGLKKISW